MPTFVAIALRPDVVVTAMRVAAVVGTILVAINHGPALAAGTFESGRVIQVLLTYCVPYGVSTYSAVRAIQRAGAMSEPIRES